MVTLFHICSVQYVKLLVPARFDEKLTFCLRNNRDLGLP